MGIIDRIRAALRREDDEIIREAQEVGAPEAERLEREREDFAGHQADDAIEGHGGVTPM
jgi:hypothetical protein